MGLSVVILYGNLVIDPGMDGGIVSVAGKLTVSRFEAASHHPNNHRFQIKAAIGAIVLHALYEEIRGTSGKEIYRSLHEHRNGALMIVVHGNHDR